MVSVLSDPPHPQPSLRGARKELVRYARADGVMLSATLHTPPGYDAGRDGPLPTILWAYPREYKSSKSAEQARGAQPLRGAAAVTAALPAKSPAKSPATVTATLTTALTRRADPPR